MASRSVDRGSGQSRSSGDGLDDDGSGSGFGDGGLGLRSRRSHRFSFLSRLASFLSTTEGCTTVGRPGRIQLRWRRSGGGIMSRVSIFDFWDLYLYFCIVFVFAGEPHKHPHVKNGFLHVGASLAWKNCYFRIPFRADGRPQPHGKIGFNRIQKYFIFSSVWSLSYKTIHHWSL